MRIRQDRDLIGLCPCQNSTLRSKAYMPVHIKFAGTKPLNKGLKYNANVSFSCKSVPGQVKLPRLLPVWLHVASSSWPKVALGAPTIHIMIPDDKMMGGESGSFS